MTLREAVATFRGHRVPRIDIIGRTKWWFALSGLVLALSLVGLLARGLNFSISFTGGALLSFENRSGASVEDYEEVMAGFGVDEAHVETLGTNQVHIRTESLVERTPAVPPTPVPGPTTSPTPTAAAAAAQSPSPGATASPGGTPSPGTTASPVPTPTPTPEPNPRADRIRAAVARVAGVSVNDVNLQDVGPTWGSTISRKAITGLIVFLVLVTLYITMRFELKMAWGALVALGHDVLVTAGIYALVGREVTPETVVAILTILGYSLYDTVVIYDKVNENTESAALVARETYSGVVNSSLNQVFMRSVNTSLVVLAPIGALLLFGGQTLKDFAFALFVGTATGAYSSICVAAPVLALLKEREPRFQQIRARAQARAGRPGLRVVTAPEGPAAEERRLEPAAARPAAATAAAGAGRTAGAATAGRRSTGPRKKKGRPQGKPKPRRR